MKGGTFLDIGANDGITLSNTYALAKYYGWCGMLVEASPKAYDRLLENYKQFTDREFDLANVAIGKEDGELEFYESGEHLRKGDVGLLSTGMKGELDRWHDMEFEKIMVPMESFKTMLSKSRFHKFDLLSIDIEGMELEVLPQIDFSALGIRVAVIEWNSKNREAYNAIMLPQGFKLVDSNLENLIYLKL
jgi:FkbM family methyltransferase